MEGKKNGIPKNIGPFPPTPGRAPEEATNIAEKKKPQNDEQRECERESKRVQKGRL